MNERIEVLMESDPTTFFTKLPSTSKKITAQKKTKTKRKTSKRKKKVKRDEWDSDEDEDELPLPFNESLQEILGNHVVMILLAASIRNIALYLIMSIQQNLLPSRSRGLGYYPLNVN